MPIKQPGSPNPPLSMSEIYNEFKDRDNVPNEEGQPKHRLGEYYNVDIGVPASGAISISDFYGKADVFEYVIPNKANNAFYNNVNLVAEIKAAGWNGQAKVDIVIQGKIKSTSTGTPACTLDFNGESQGAPQLITINVQSSGAIIGRGGNGGGYSGSNGQNGGNGGDGSLWDGLEGNVIVENQGYICGGGGGGGAMHRRRGNDHNGGGGGGAGAGNGGNQAGQGRSYSGGAGGTTWGGKGANGGGYNSNSQGGKGGGAGGGGGGYLAGQAGKNNDGAGAGGGGGLDPIDGTGGNGGANASGKGGNYNTAGGSSTTGGGGGFGKAGGNGNKSGGSAGSAIVVGGGTATAYTGSGVVRGANGA